MKCTILDKWACHSTDMWCDYQEIWEVEMKKMTVDNDHGESMG